jgi:hypothetical protein
MREGVDEDKAMTLAMHEGLVGEASAATPTSVAALCLGGHACGLLEE